MKLDFIFIGPDKSGSTWLYEQLLAHPEVFVPKAKDLYFFDKNFSRGLSWYEKFFNDAAEPIKGEISHDYIFSIEAIQRIHDKYPDVKLITFLRNPLDKVWSHYLFLIRSGITNQKFEVALQQFPELIDKALLYPNLKNVLDVFPKEQVGVFLFDDLKKSPESLADRVFSFLGVAKHKNEFVSKNPLPASKPRNFYLAKFAKIFSNILRRFHLENLLGAIKRNSLVKKVLYKKYETKPEMPLSIKKELYSVHFKKDVEMLENLLGLDLENWKIKK